MPDRLRSVLPEPIASQILDEIEAARTRDLPVAMLMHRALELAGKGLPGPEIIEDIGTQHRFLWLGREALRAGGRPNPSDEEVEAASSAIGRGADEAAVSMLARSAPAERPLAVPLSVVASLMGRGLPADDVVAAMHVWLTSNASDTELHDLAGPPPRPELTVIRAKSD